MTANAWTSSSCRAGFACILAGLSGEMRRRSLRCPDRGQPRFGMQFHPERRQVYTIFSTSQWLVCIDAPDDKATLDLTVALPAGLLAAGPGALVSEQPGGDGTVAHRWRQSRPVSTFLYGFAAGPFVQLEGRHGETSLRYLGDGQSRDELGRIFNTTPDMLDFFASRAGVELSRRRLYPGAGCPDRRTGGVRLLDTVRGLRARPPERTGRRLADGPRAGAPVVGQPRDVRGLEALLAERRLRDVHGGGLRGAPNSDRRRIAGRLNARGSAMKTCA